MRLLSHARKTCTKGILWSLKDQMDMQGTFKKWVGNYLTDSDIELMHAYIARNSFYPSGLGIKSTISLTIVKFPVTLMTCKQLSIKENPIRHAKYQLGTYLKGTVHVWLWPR